MFTSKALEYQVLPIPFYVLTMWGMWCPSEKLWIRRNYSFFTITVIVAITLLTLAVFIYVIKNMFKAEFDLNVFFVFSSLLVGMYKGLNIFFNRSTIIDLLKAGFSDYWRVPRNYLEKNIVTNYSQRSWEMQVVYTVSCFIGVLIKLLGPVMDSSLELPTLAWYPYNMDKPLYFWLSYAHQMFVGTASISLHIGSDTLHSGFLIQLCKQLQLLKCRLENFYKFTHKIHGIPHGSSAAYAKYEKDLIKQCIIDHNFLYSYSKTLNNYISGWIMSLLTVIVPNVCINVYILSISEIKADATTITSIALLTIVLIQIFLPCWYGNEIRLRSLEIKNAVYNMDWINVTPNTRKLLILIMMRAAEPILIDVAGIIPMNLNTFLRILKASYSALSVLQQRKI